MHATDCKQGICSQLIPTLEDMLVLSVEAVSCLDRVSSQAVELVDGYVGLHVGKFWWRDHLEQCAMPLRWSHRQSVHELT